MNGTLEADDITVNGTALNTVIAGVTVNNAATVTVSDSKTNTNFPIVFHDESNGLLDDTGSLTYNPSTGILKLADSKKIVFGADPDLEIYHDGSNSFISDTGTGDLVIEGTHLRLRSKDTVETYILCEQNSSVELYHNNIKKLETTSTGITVTGTINGSISGNAATVTNGIYTTSSVTDLSDVSSVGSGSIITSAERTKLSGIEASAK